MKLFSLFFLFALFLPAANRLAPQLRSQPLTTPHTTHSEKCPLSIGKDHIDDQPDTIRPANMVFVSGGTFIMGCKEGRETGYYYEQKPDHNVSLRDFYIGRYEVTNGEYCQFLNEKGNQSEGGKPWLNIYHSRIIQSDSGFTVKGGFESHPIVSVTWYGAVAYCAWLSQHTGLKYRLPSEAEWEYAARGGNKTQHFIYAGSNTPDEVAWYGENSFLKTQPVGTKKANELDLYDLSGNVHEWCADDWHRNYHRGAPTDGSAWVDSPQRGDFRVYRGGSWDDWSLYCGAAYRKYNRPTSHSATMGFRLALGY